MELKKTAQGYVPKDEEVVALNSKTGKKVPKYVVTGKKGGWIVKQFSNLQQKYVELKKIKNLKEASLFLNKEYYGDSRGVEVIAHEALSVQPEEKVYTEEKVPAKKISTSELKKLTAEIMNRKTVSSRCEISGYNTNENGMITRVEFTVGKKFYKASLNDNGTWATSIDVAV